MKVQRWRRLLSVLLLLPGGVPSQARTAVVIPTAPSCPTCRIVVQHGAVLDVPRDSFSFEFVAKLTRSANGSILAWGLRETRIPVIFDSNGVFRGLIGREGIGPGELQRTAAIGLGPANSIWVTEGARVHIFSPALRFVERRTFPAARDMAFGSKGRIVVAASIASPRSAGYPLHRVSGAGLIESSFGIEVAPIDSRRIEASGDNRSAIETRFITPGDSNSFWTYNPTRFLLERYDFDGNLLLRARHALEGWYREATERGPSPGELRDAPLMHVQASRHEGIVWLSYAVRNNNYDENWAISGLSLARWAKMHDFVIEAFDWRAGRVVAFTRVGQTVAIKVRDAIDMVAFVRPIDNLTHSYQLASLRLSR